MECPYCQHYYESYESLCCDIQPPDKWIHKFTSGMVRKKVEEKLNKTCPLGENTMKPLDIKPDV